MTNKIRKAVFPAAGLGTRFLPATKASPKEMLPLVDKPLIQYSVEEAVASGCESILIITGRDKTAIEDHFDISFELEQMLLEKGKEEPFPNGPCDLGHRHASATHGKNKPSGWATRSIRQRTLWATSLLRLCLPTTLSMLRGRRCDK